MDICSDFILEYGRGVDQEEDEGKRKVIFEQHKYPREIRVKL